MDNSSAGGGHQPERQREQHGPRPDPLTVRKESRKIKKPPAVTPPLPPQQQQQQQYRPPVIIYAVSPKVIHTTPADFMSVVQSLTGGRAPSASDPQGDRGPVPPFSPAARLATFEKTATSAPSASARTLKREEFDDVAVEVISSPEQRRGGGGGILSPGPASLPWISPAIFTSTAIHTPPSIQFVESPNNNLLFSGTGMVPSPAAYWDLFSHYQH